MDTCSTPDSLVQLASYAFANTDKEIEGERESESSQSVLLKPSEGKELKLEKRRASDGKGAREAQQKVMWRRHDRRRPYTAIQKSYIVK